MKKDVNNFINTLQQSIITWDYFSDFEKVKKNTFKIKVQLNILNSLLGENNLKDKFFSVVEKYPETREALLVLIATRKSKISEMPILDAVSLITEDKSYLFDKKIKINNQIKQELWKFLEETGLLSIFNSKHVNNLEDYVFGVETGLDSNARKNRTGKLMENIVEEFISYFCQNNKLQYMSQATRTKILNEYGLDLKIEGLKKKRGERKFDFVIFDKIKNKLTIIETNYYGSTGSKPSSIAREYIDLDKILKRENVSFIWVTDGLGWKKMKNPLEKTIDENDYVINIQMLKDGILNDIFKK